MAIVEEVTNVSTNLIEQIGQIGLWLKTLGIIVVLWIIFQSVQFYFNLKRLKEIHLIKQHMNIMEKKLNKILAKKK